MKVVTKKQIFIEVLKSPIYLMGSIIIIIFDIFTSWGDFKIIPLMYLGWFYIEIMKNHKKINWYSKRDLRYYQFEKEDLK